MKLAIFGASGVVGRVLIPRLLADGHHIRAMRHKAALPDGVTAIDGDLSDPAAVAATIGDAEIVVQMTKGGAGIEQAVTTSVRGTINVLDAIVRRGGVRQYLLTSSDAAAGIWSHPHAGPISHRTPSMSYGGYYSLGKVLEEVIAREAVRNHGVPTTVARLSYVHQEDSAMKVFLAQARRGPFSGNYSDVQKAKLVAGGSFVVLPLNPDGKTLGRTLVQREDVIEALAAMVGAPAAVGQTFHISGPAFDYAEPCEYLSGKLGLPVERVTVPGAHSFAIDYSLTCEKLGWEPKYDVTAMLEAALAWRAGHGD